MAQAPLILNYNALRPKPGTRLAMEEGEGQVRVLFSVTPRWMFLIPMAIALLIAVGCLIQPCIDIAFWWQTGGLRAFLWAEGGRKALHELVIPAPWAAIALAAAGLAIWRYRRWSRDHRILVATKDGLLLSRVGWWRLHRRWWPADQIAAVEIRPVWGSVRVIDTVAYLIVHGRDGRRRRFYLDTPDRTLPGRIAERLSAVLGCPLNGQDGLNRQGAKTPGENTG
ncbi:MAG TPA: hypothetical protein VHY37_00540 [Tepidisphaeraceae bacterium]|nr:hypothetical protein [Tepidisphaeraceae bacterium]